MPREIIIRPYELCDRIVVRDISCDTADRGGPIESFFADRETVADLLTRYYTDHEPQALWVAECGKEVVGYLTGCLDSRRYFRIEKSNIAPKAVIKAIVRGTFWQKETWRLLIAMIKTWRLGGYPVNIPLEKYPAHLHINIKNGFRGEGVGQRLMERFGEQVKTKNIKGIHASVREDNVSACKFFEKAGFHVLSRYPVIWPSEGVLAVHYTAIYGKIVL